MGTKEGSLGSPIEYLLYQVGVFRGVLRKCQDELGTGRVTHLTKLALEMEKVLSGTGANPNGRE